MMVFIKSSFVILLLLNYWTLNTSQLSVISSVDDLMASLRAFIMKDHVQSINEINEFVPRARDYARYAMKSAVPMVDKQLKPMLEAIANAKRNGIQDDCDMMFYKMEDERKYIAQQAADALGDCDGIEDELQYLSEEVEEVLQQIESCKSDAGRMLLDCTTDQSNSKDDLQQCLDPVFKTYRDNMNKLFEKKMKKLRHSFEEALEGVDEYMFRCLLNARVQVLRRSRDAADRINYCVVNNKIPLQPPGQQKMPWDRDNNGKWMREHIVQRLQVVKKMKQESEASQGDD